MYYENRFIGLTTKFNMTYFDNAFKTSGNYSVASRVINNASLCVFAEIVDMIIKDETFKATEDYKYHIKRIENNIRELQVRIGMTVEAKHYFPDTTTKQTYQHMLNRLEGYMNTKEEKVNNLFWATVNGIFYVDYDENKGVLEKYIKYLIANRDLRTEPPTILKGYAAVNVEKVTSNMFIYEKWVTKTGGRLLGSTLEQLGFQMEYLDETIEYMIGRYIATRNIYGLLTLKEYTKQVVPV